MARGRRGSRRGGRTCTSQTAEVSETKVAVEPDNEIVQVSLELNNKNLKSSTESIDPVESSTAVTQKSSTAEVCDSSDVADSVKDSTNDHDVDDSISQSTVLIGDDMLQTNHLTENLSKSVSEQDVSTYVDCDESLEQTTDDVCDDDAIETMETNVPEEDLNVLASEQSIKQYLISKKLSEEKAETIHAKLSGLITCADLSDDVVKHLLELSDKDLPVAVSEFAETDFANISGKSSHFLGILKSWKDHSQLSIKDGIKSASSAKRAALDERIADLVTSTNYEHEVLAMQRRYGPPKDYTGEKPSHSTEVFIGNLPRETLEDELVPVINEASGERSIYDLRIMVEGNHTTNRGYAFVQFCTEEQAKQVVKKLNGYEIRSGRNLKVKHSTPNVRLFIGNIPRNKSKEELLEEFKSKAENITDCIVYVNADDPSKKNRGYCFLEFRTHGDAANARRKWMHSGFRLWNQNLICDWADAQAEPNEEVMSQVKVVYIKYVSQEITENILQNICEKALKPNADIDSLLSSYMDTPGKDAESEKVNQTAEKKDEEVSTRESDECQTTEIEQESVGIEEKSAKDVDSTVGVSQDEDRVEVTTTATDDVEQTTEHKNSDETIEVEKPNIERVRKMKDYAFVHCAQREGALKLIELLHKKKIGRCNVEVSLAKPTDKSGTRGRGGFRDRGRNASQMSDRLGSWNEKGRGFGYGDTSNMGRFDPRGFPMNGNRSGYNRGNWNNNPGGFGRPVAGMSPMRGGTFGDGYKRPAPYEDYRGGKRARNY